MEKYVKSDFEGRSANAMIMLEELWDNRKIGFYKKQFTKHYFVV